MDNGDAHKVELYRKYKICYFIPCYNFLEESKLKILEYILLPNICSIDWVLKIESYLLI